MKRVDGVTVIDEGTRETALAQVNAARAAITRTCEQLKNGLEDYVAQGRTAGERGESEALRAGISELEVQLSALDTAVATLQGGLDSQQQKGELAWPQRAQFELLKRKLDEQLRYRDRMNQLIGQYKIQLKQAHAEADLLRGSFAFRIGSYLVAAVKSPRGMVLLPARMLRLAKDAWPRIHRRIQSLFSANDADSQPDLGPDVSLVGDAVEWASRIPTSSHPVRRMLIGTESAPQLPPDLPRMRIATVMDEFSFNAFRHCGDLRQIGADDWRMEIEAFAPHMLFVESAWKGKDESWSRKVYPLSREMVELIAWCRDRKIPAVFWNKEDPVHLSVFMRTARQFDFVFTTDIDCVRLYKAALGHDQVYWLPFACQPREHNPIEEYQRKDGFCFAGSFYAKYPDRQRDFATLVESMKGLRPFEIFDRNAGKVDPALVYPDQYQPLIRGALPYERISFAYKGYRYGVNINTVKQSQSMFARRVFDLLACNTVTVSNYSRGLRNLLGDLVISSDDGGELRRRVKPLLDDDRRYRRFRLAGLRKVMSEHTYQDRLRYVLEKVGARCIDDGLPRVLAVAHAESEEEFVSIVGSFEIQAYRHKKLKLVVTDELMCRLPAAEKVGIEVVSHADAGRFRLRDAGPETWLAYLCSEDHYGANYLTDLALATRYSDATAIGKATHHEWADGMIRLVDEELAYATGQSIPMRRAMARSSAIPALDLLSFVREARTIQVRDACCIDEFNYCAGGAGVDASSVDDLPDLWTGIPQSALHDLAETATAADLRDAEASTASAMTAEALAELLPLGKHGDQRVSLVKGDNELRLHSSLPGDKHVYLYASKPAPVSQFFHSEIGKFNLVVDSEMLISFVIIYMDKDRQRIGHAIRACSSNLSISPPAGTCYVRLGLRIQGPGTAGIKRLVLGHVPSPAAGIPGRGEYLVVSRGYPSYDNLYSYAYVHRRVLGYSETGVPVDVFRLTEDSAAFEEFEGVDVVCGQLPDLELMLRTNPYKAVLVHSLDRSLWSVLKECGSDVEILVWVHGAEIQPWYRRDFSFFDDRDRERGVQRSNDRMALWRELFSASPDNVRFVFVSRHLAREAFRDVGIELDVSRYEIVHNHVDGDFFRYLEKDPEQRKRVLSIRPYSRPTYANDLAVKAILDLVDEPFFSELEFRLIGDGGMFDEIVAPLRDLPNVILEKRFVTQREIAALHRDYGVFLCPSRIDSQGVSRDEAMASGLVPITNRVSAVPEFVDEDCAFLAEAEDWRGLANALRRLHAEPETFSRMSESAARRVRAQSGRQQTLLREVALIAGSPAASDVASGAEEPIIERRRRIAVYGDLDLNLIDGSAVWAASLAQVLAGFDDVDVDLFLKAPIRSTQVIRELLGLVNVRLVEPTATNGKRRREDALDCILEEDAVRGYRAIVLRGLDLAHAAVGRPGFENRLWVYLTDVPQRRDEMIPERLEMLQKVAEGAALVLCQTVLLQQHIVSLAPAAMEKVRLLPPMIPYRHRQRSRPPRKPGQPLRLAYAGKFAPLWGIRELFDTVDKLRVDGMSIELHVFGDKIHNPADDPNFRGFVQDRLQSGNGLIWHRGLSRTDVLDRLSGMDVGWAWRHAQLEEAGMELSTKVLEYLACGLPVLLAKNQVNVDLLGRDYPLFVSAGNLIETLRNLILGSLHGDELQSRIEGIAQRYTFHAVRSNCVAPLLSPRSVMESGGED